MFSYRRKEARPDPDKLELAEPFPCALCGEMAVRRVQGSCKLLDGTVIRKLSRFRCSKCGEDFFDRAAMKEIRRQRRERPNSQIIAPRQRTRKVLRRHG